MRATEGRVGRVFVLRLEEGDVLPGSIERFAETKGIVHAQAILIGGISEGDVIVGPCREDERPLRTMKAAVDGVHEVLGAGLLAPGEDGKPVLHMHGALGRSGRTTTGCFRLGVKTWHLVEAVLWELLDVEATRVKDESTGLAFLEPGVRPASSVD